MVRMYWSPFSYMMHIFAFHLELKNGEVHMYKMLKKVHQQMQILDVQKLVEQKMDDEDMKTLQ